LITQQQQLEHTTAWANSLESGESDKSNWIYVSIMASTATFSTVAFGHYKLVYYDSCEE